MDIYKGKQLSRNWNTTNHWVQVITNQPAEINRNICSVRELSLAVIVITSTATPPLLQEITTCFLDVLIDWGSTWSWDSPQLVGVENWLEEALDRVAYNAQK